MSTDRIDYNENGLDDVVVHNVTMFRMERMTNNSFWIKCYRDDKPNLVFNLHSDGKITGNHEYED